MTTSKAGIALIKRYEGCRLQAYKPIPAERYYTIGYGHYGPDVAPNMVISQAEAEAILVNDLKKYEQAVNSTGLALNQSQFDALVSFAYNCGVGNLKKLVANRTPEQIADAMLAYNKGSGKVLPGLTKRRQEERALFLSSNPTGNPYPVPEKSIKLNSKGNGVRWLQYILNDKGGYKLIVDGVAGLLTIGAVMDWQKKHGLEADGIVGPKTKESLLGSQ
jgi:GH24 family phage-related lysozyme (muramidase)